jgi:hypothetical protein
MWPYVPSSPPVKLCEKLVWLVSSLIYTYMNVIMNLFETEKFSRSRSTTLTSVQSRREIAPSLEIIISQQPRDQIGNGVISCALSNRVIPSMCLDALIGTVEVVHTLDEGVASRRLDSGMPACCDGDVELNGRELNTEHLHNY